MVKIEYFGHSCFRVSAQGYSIVFDPYQDSSVPGLKLPQPLSANEVLISHGHEDHNAAEKVTIEKAAGKNPFQEFFLTVPHDDSNGSKRGFNKIHILEADGLRIAHFGDLGRMLNIDEINRLRDATVLMIPCGGYFTIDAQQAKAIIDRTQPQLAILMHYRTASTGYSLIESIDQVHKAIPELQLLDQTTLEISPDNPIRGIVALKAIQ